MKDILDKLDAIETPVAGVAAPTLPSPIQLDESAQLRVLAGQSSLLTEAAKVKKPKAKKEEKVEEQQVESLDDDMEEDLEESAAQIAAQEKFKNLVTKVSPTAKSGTATDAMKSQSGKGKKPDGKGGAAFKKELDQHMKEDSKPSAGLTKKEKSAVVKKAVAGKDIGKKGKGFEKVEKAAAKGVAKDPKAVAAAAMWKGQAKKKAVKESIEPKLTFKQMVTLVQESGGQQQIDAVDTELFAWAQRVASAKYEGVKQELYAGMVYENMGGEFRMFDVLSEAMTGHPDTWSDPRWDGPDSAEAPVSHKALEYFNDNFYEIAWPSVAEELKAMIENDESGDIMWPIVAIGKSKYGNEKVNTAAELGKIKNAILNMLDEKTINDIYDNAISKFWSKHNTDPSFQDKNDESFEESFDEEFEEAFGKHQAKQNWFETLNAALESEGLVDQWPTGRNISYGQTVRVKSNDGERLISVTRETDGRYERPVHYKLR
jgi:hypothetical protein